MGCVRVGTTEDGSAISAIDVAYLVSTRVGDEFQILVAQTGMDLTGPPQHVLVVTDTLLHYGLALEMARLYRFARILPPLLVVGVGYRATHFSETVERRTRDLTSVPVLGRGGGGAEAFLAFLQQELKPYLAGRYGVADADYTWFGHSLGGLFGAWVLLTQPQSFHRYGLGSPSIWWGSRAILDVESAYAAAHDGLPARVFIGAGAMESPAGRLHAIKWLPEEQRGDAYAEVEAGTAPMAADDAALLASRLERRHYPGLVLEHRTFPNEFHETVLGLNLSWSLRSLFDAPR